ncbi:MAG: helix-turn-helix domain-containing protein [Pseudomonadota bacterium]
MQRDTAQGNTVIATGNLASAQRTIGGILGQLEAVGIDRTKAVSILSGVGLPAIAYDDPSFPISLDQDFELINEICKHMPDGVSAEVSLCMRMLGTRVNMFGALGLAWQSAPTILDAFRAILQYPQANWGRSSMVLSTSATEERVDYHLDKNLLPFTAAEDIEATYKYALLLDVTASFAITMDIMSDRALVKEMQLPFVQPPDWSVVAKLMPFPVRFEAPHAAAVYHPGFLQNVPRRAHEISFRLAMKLVGKESAILTDDITLRDQVIRWLWASSPPLTKPEIANLLNISERSLTRRLAAEDSSYNQLFAQVQAERAQNLLGNGKLTIAAVAYRMGYSDPAAFTRAFSAWLGVTPSEWRQQHN